jgi:hypothetical protein
MVDDQSSVQGLDILDLWISLRPLYLLEYHLCYGDYVVGNSAILSYASAIQRINRRESMVIQWRRNKLRVESPEIGTGTFVPADWRDDECAGIKCAGIKCAGIKCAGIKCAGINWFPVPFPILRSLLPFTSLSWVLFQYGGGYLRVMHDLSLSFVKRCVERFLL